MPAIIYTAPEAVNWLEVHQYPSIFLAGAIDQGKALEWQLQVIEALQDAQVVILNPRRLDWDDSWQQSMEDPRFFEQVRWELEGLESVNCVAMYFPSAAQAPISLLECGLVAKSGRLIVAAESTYYRRGNLEVVCDRYQIHLLTSLSELIHHLRGWVKDF